MRDSHSTDPERAVQPKFRMRGVAGGLLLLAAIGLFGRRISFPLAPLDNVEALAVEALGAGKRRLWLMTDDNIQPPVRTLLVALDLPALEPAEGC